MIKARSIIAVITLMTVIFGLSAMDAISQTKVSKGIPPAEPPAGSGASEINVNPASKARIKVDSDIYDFGSIQKGMTVVHSYVIKNVGQDTLIVSRVRPTCGCTLAPLSSDHIPPGGEATIRTSFNTQKFNGRVKKDIYVDCNDPIDPYFKLSFTAIINNPLELLQIDPVQADLGSVQKDAPGEAKVKITNNGDNPLSLAIVEQSTPDIKVKFASATVAPKSSTDLVLNYSPAKKGDIAESITIESPGNEDTRITIPIKGTVTQ